MTQFRNDYRCRLYIWVILAFTTSWFATCTSVPKVPSIQTPDPTDLFASALLTATHAVTTEPGTQSQTSLEPTTLPTESKPTPSTDIARTPPPLPPLFQTSSLPEGSIPQKYIQDTCEDLKARWDPNNSAPGTVVMPVMYHSVVADYREELSPDGTQVRHSDMVILLEHAREVGFETITTQQLVNFLEHNAKIPHRSLLLIVDDRRPGVVKEHFMPYLEEYNWTLTLGWLIGDTDSKPASVLNCCPDENFGSLWEQMEAYNATGRLDVQAHGYIHNIPINQNSTEAFIYHEIVDSRKVLQDHFYCKDQVENCETTQPLAYIWPGGGFTMRGAQVARENGYRLGFTINPRGPVMFNWIPLGQTIDPNHPSWLPEVPAGDALMVLPRYWSKDAAFRIDDVASIGEEAAAYAKQNKQVELEYYDIVCKSITGEIPPLSD